MINGHFAAYYEIYVYAQHGLLADHNWHSVSMEHSDHLDTDIVFFAYNLCSSTKTSRLSVAGYYTFGNLNNFHVNFK